MKKEELGILLALVKATWPSQFAIEPDEGNIPGTAKNWWFYVRDLPAKACYEAVKQYGESLEKFPPGPAMISGMVKAAIKKGHKQITVEEAFLWAKNKLLGYYHPYGASPPKDWIRQNMNEHPQAVRAALAVGLDRVKSCTGQDRAFCLRDFKEAYNSISEVEESNTKNLQISSNGVRLLVDKTSESV